MDNIIVNSALWYAEQSSQFLVNLDTQLFCQYRR